MTRNAFFAALAARLSGVPGVDSEKILEYYGEMLDDLLEEGTPEEVAACESSYTGMFLKDKLIENL